MAAHDPAQSDAQLPSYQGTIEFTFKGTEDECEAKIDKLRTLARRLGHQGEFCEIEPNCDLDSRERH